MANSEDLNQRLTKLALSRQQSWEAVREAQTFVRTGIANFENRSPRWAKPTPPLPESPPILPRHPWHQRIPARIWQTLPILLGTVLGLWCAGWLGAW